MKMKEEEKEYKSHLGNNFSKNKKVFKYYIDKIILILSEYFDVNFLFKQ